MIFPKENGKLIFPVAGGRITLSGRDQELRTPTWIRDHPIRGEGHVDFRGESEGSLSPPADSRLISGCGWSDEWFLVHVRKLHISPSRWTRVKLCSPREESFPIPLKSSELLIQTWMLCKNVASTIIGTSMGQEICLALGQVSLSFLYWKRNLQTDICGSGWRLTKRQVASRPDHLGPELWIKTGRNAKLKERQQWSHEKPKLDNARKLRGIYFIDPEDEEFKETIKNARKKLETPMAPTMLCKMSKNNKHGDIRSETNDFKSKLACILEASESQDCVWKNLYRIIMTTILQERETIHCNIVIWYTNLFYASSHEDSRSKGSSG